MSGVSMSLYFVRCQYVSTYSRAAMDRLHSRRMRPAATASFLASSTLMAPTLPRSISRISCLCLCVCVCVRGGRVGAAMGVVGGGGSWTDSLHGMGYDSGHERRTEVMLGECGWTWRSEVCFVGVTSMFVRGTCLRPPTHVSSLI